jgi:peptide/nickel transport system permease protein
MIAFVARRLVSGVLVLLAVSMAVFALFFYGPADPALAYCPETRCTPERLDNIRDSLGLDEPVTEQYAAYLGGVVAGRELRQGSITIDCPAPCLGVSFKLRVPVTEYLAGRFPATLSVALGAAVVFLVVGVTAGVTAARRHGTGTDRAVVGASLLLGSVPYYLLALLAWLYLVNAWGVFPDTGYAGLLSEGPVAWAKGLLLPWLVLGLAYATQYARYSRASMVEVLQADFVRTARAKGLSERAVTLRHGLRAGIVPVVTLLGLDLALLLAGTVFTERIFDIPGIGLAALEAIDDRDLPVIAGTVILGAAFIVVANLVVDVVHVLLDPRVRLDSPAAT